MKIPFWSAVIVGGIIGATLSGLAWKNVHSKTRDKNFYISSKYSIVDRPLYAYKSANNFLYFIDVLICIDLVNRTSDFSKVYDYYGQLLVGKEWITLGRVQFEEQGKFYLIGQDIEKSREIEFNHKTFDEQIGYSNKAFEEFPAACRVG